MSDMPPVEQLEFLRENGEQYAILGSGERVRPGTEGLPRDAGTHLVAGTACPGGMKKVANLPPGRPILDPTHRWLGIGDYKKPIVQLFDTTKNCSPAFRFQSPGLKAGVAIHPEGDLVAARVRDRIVLYGPDGHQLRSARFPKSREWWGAEAFKFSTCGKYLWFVLTPPDGKGVLLLLHCPSLEVADSWEQEDELETGYGSWCEVSAAVVPVSGDYVIYRQAGDSFMGVRFYEARKGKIHLLPQEFGRYDSDFHGERIWMPVFDREGTRFVFRDGDGYFYEFSCYCRHIAEVPEWTLRQDGDDHEARITSFGYAGGGVVAILGDELIQLRSGDLAFSPHVLPGGGTEVLPNGVLLDRYSNVNDVWEVKPPGDAFPVIVALDSKTNRATWFYRKDGAEWIALEAYDQGFDIGWVESNFALAER